MRIVDEHAARVALDAVGGHAFERFAQSFLAATLGERFVPLGGVKDGGADGLLEREDGHPTRFAQATVEDEADSKIRGTVARLREFGRTPMHLIYITSKDVRYVDKVENDLSEELGLTIRIRERSYILAHINDDTAARAAFWNHLEPEIRFLGSLGRAGVLAPSKHVSTPEIFVFLRQEVERRDGDADLVHAVLDALILWALEETDPDKSQFLTVAEVTEKIFATLPALREIVHAGEVNNRLQAMASKQYSSGRAVQWHPKAKGYCLPFSALLNGEWVRFGEDSDGRELRRRAAEKEHGDEAVGGMKAVRAAGDHASLTVEPFRATIG